MRNIPKAVAKRQRHCCRFAILLVAIWLNQPPAEAGNTQIPAALGDTKAPGAQVAAELIPQPPAAPRPIQIEPMVAPVARTAPAMPKAAGTGASVPAQKSAAPGCAAGYRLAKAGNRCVRVTAGAVAPKGRPIKASEKPKN